ncbi:MAG: hypothetical protein WBW94_03530 [Anaerolineales bacterium]
MASQTQTDSAFDIGKCRAKVTGAGDLVDCLSSERARSRGFSLSFGNGHFCKHPRQNEFIGNNEKLQGTSNSLMDISQADLQ